MPTTDRRALDAMMSPQTPLESLGVARAYTPTWRERTAGLLQDAIEKLGGERYFARKVAETVAGGPSSNLPLRMGLLDPTVVGSFFGRQEASAGGAPMGPGAPPGLLNNALFIGAKARTWDAKAAAVADEMERAGQSRKAIFEATGTIRGKDGNWRQEIPDNIWPETNAAPLTTVGAAFPGHRALFAAYPDIAEIKLRGLDEFDGMRGAYASGPIEEIFAQRRDGQGYARDALLHELQHAIQKREGFSFGGVANAHDYASSARYRALPGEIEARLVESRASIPANMRRKMLPSFDE